MGAAEKAGGRRLVQRGQREGGSLVRLDRRREMEATGRGCWPKKKWSKGRAGPGQRLGREGQGKKAGWLGRGKRKKGAGPKKGELAEHRKKRKQNEKGAQN